MPKTKDIEYIVDAKGRRTRVILSFRAYQELMQELADLREMEDPASESWEDLDKVLSEIENARKV